MNGKLKTIAALSLCASMFASIGLVGCAREEKDDGLDDNLTLDRSNFYVLSAKEDAYVVIDGVLHTGDVYQLATLKAGYGIAMVDVDCTEKDDYFGYDMKVYDKDFKPSEKVYPNGVCEKCLGGK